MKKFIFFLPVVVSLYAPLAAQNAATVVLTPITAPHLRASMTETRTIYSPECRFSGSDTVLFTRKQRGLTITTVDSAGPRELACVFRLDSTFVDFGVHEMIVVSANGERKKIANVEVRLAQMPVVDHVTVYQGIRGRRDTLRLAGGSRTLAAMVVSGRALLSSCAVEFDDPAIKAVNESIRRFSDAPDSFRISLEIDARNCPLGPHTFRISSPYGPEGFGQLWLASERPPKIQSTVPSIIADGRERKVRLNGEQFFKGVQVRLWPIANDLVCENSSSGVLEVSLALPVVDRNETYRLIVENADGQADTSNFFIGQTMPLSFARAQRIEDGLLFVNRKTRLILQVEVVANRRLQRNRPYEVVIGQDRFPLTRVIDDSTAEVEVLLQDRADQELLDKRSFTVSEVNCVPLWKGILETQQPPQIKFVSAQRILHSQDTLNLIIKGDHLAKADIYIDETDVNFKILERRDDLIRSQVVSGRTVLAGVYPMELRVSGIPFRFQDHTLTVQPWRPFAEYCRMDIAPQQGPVSRVEWKKSIRYVNADDAIRVTLLPEMLPENSGTQKLEISGVLLDSANIVKAESMDRKFYTVEKGQEPMLWQWRSRIKPKSGERIEVLLRNPGDQNRLSQTCQVKRRWYEAFQPSTSFILFKVPMGGGNTTTEILKSIGVGLSYQPDWMQKFMSVDLSFIIGNISSSDDNVSIQTGLGVSMIFWNYLQVGVGSNLTGNSKNPTFIFVGSRFKLPSPWRLS
jgi:hypothetical protein